MSLWKKPAEVPLMMCACMCVCVCPGGGGYSDVVWTGGARLKPPNPYPSLRVILVENYPLLGVWRKRVPILGIFSQENDVFAYFSDEKGENI